MTNVMADTTARRNTVAHPLIKLTSRPKILIKFLSEEKSTVGTK